MKAQPAAFIAALLGIVASLSPSHAQEGDSREGLVVAQQLCATCHSVLRGAAASPNSKAPTFEKIAAVPGMTALALSVALRTSHKEMPNIILDAEQRANVIAYILSLRAK
jgi:cytochrome c